MTFLKSIKQFLYPASEHYNRVETIKENAAISHDVKMETGSRILALDGWRGVSILFVLVGHFFPSSLKLFNMGSFGVDCFFVLSGRLMAEILFIKQSDLKQFYFRRLSRIIPGLTCFLVLSFILWSRTSFKFDWIYLLIGETFTYNYYVNFTHNHVEIIENIWSLCIEEHTYILLGIIAWITRKQGKSPIFALWAIGLLSVVDLIVTYFLTQKSVEMFWRTDTLIFSIVFGSLAYIYSKKIANDLKITAFISLVSISAAIFLELIRFPDPAKQLFVIIFLAVGVSYIEYSKYFLKQIVLNPAIRRMGMYSFSIYLWQQPFFKMAMTYESHVIRASLFLVAMAVGILSFYIVEKPMRQMLNRFFATKFPVAKA